MHGYFYSVVCPFFEKHLSCPKALDRDVTVYIGHLYNFIETTDSWFNVYPFTRINHQSFQIHLPLHVWRVCVCNKYHHHWNLTFIIVLTGQSVAIVT